MISKKIELRDVGNYRVNIDALNWAIEHCPIIYMTPLIDVKFIILGVLGETEEGKE